MNKAQINSTVDFLKKGKIILYPTDTVWGIGCDATNEDAINKIYDIKNRNSSKSLILLVSDYEMLNSYVESIPQKIKEYLLKSIQPTTVIYNNPINLPENIIANDDTIAVRVVNTGFIHNVIRKFDKPIVSTSANVSGKKTPLKYEDIEVIIKNKVDFVVELDIDILKVKPSTIVKFNEDEIVVLRE